MASRRARPPRQRGYTLIEVIVAFALLALALTLLLGTLSGSLRQVRWSGDAGRAALHAQTLIDQLGVGEPLRPGTRGGELEGGRYRWTLEVERWRDQAMPAAPQDPAAPQLLELRLAVQWGEGGPRERLQLRTLRLQPAGLEASLP
ncbi:prepilin-type N-terminal cleavage/methylation domain-containing protein [Lysobacter korlensis]|uniref:Prepilin-type N-terminal cleavage/methylation domain-containing protein n=1 Tax=Lysobacter korlensis TaxID=553636 RepID=A0ABV6RIU8_9GAMM